jgi:hypothetical protein
MIATTVKRRTPVPYPARAKYWIRLRIDPADREDAWDLFQAVSRYGGIEVRDGCFGFAEKERWLTALEDVRCRFGGQYLEPAGVAGTYSPFVSQKRGCIHG